MMQNDPSIPSFPRRTSAPPPGSPPLLASSGWWTHKGIVTLHRLLKQLSARGTVYRRLGFGHSLVLHKRVALNDGGGGRAKRSESARTADEIECEWGGYGLDKRGMIHERDRARTFT
jgi:hypothetical protein